MDAHNHHFHHHHHQPRHHHHHHHQHHPPPAAMATNSSYLPNTSPSAMINPNTSTLHPTARFPFNSMATPPSSKPLESLNSPFSGDGSSGLRPGGGVGGGVGGIESSKKKRGRPRKYSPDGGGIDLGLAPTPIGSSVNQVGDGSNGGGGGDSGGTPSSDVAAGMKHRGRPPGSSKVQLDALGNCGVGFTPHVVMVNAGEDIASKIVAFSKQGPRTVCILAANGSICNVTLRQPATSGGTVTYEGRFQIISLSGSFLFSEKGGGQIRTGGLSVSLAGSDGQVLGGSVAGRLMAATTVQIIVGSFIADGKKSKYMPAVTKSQMSSFAPPTLPSTTTPPSDEASSQSSDDDDGSDHVDRTGVPYPNSNQPLHNMHIYSSLGWPNSAPA